MEEEGKGREKREKEGGSRRGREEGEVRDGVAWQGVSGEEEMGRGKKKEKVRKDGRERRGEKEEGGGGRTRREPHICEIEATWRIKLHQP